MALPHIRDIFCLVPWRTRTRISEIKIPSLAEARRYTTPAGSVDFTGQVHTVPDMRVRTLLGKAYPHEQAPRSECARGFKHSIGEKSRRETRDGKRRAQHPDGGAGGGESG